METASIIVDLHSMRCGNCKVAIADQLAISCPTCGAVFDRIVSNHVGLAAKLQEIRKAIGPPVYRVISERLLTGLSELLNADGTRSGTAANAIAAILSDSPTVNDSLSEDQLERASHADGKALEITRSENPG
jgi:hypothetical protein